MWKLYVSELDGRSRFLNLVLQVSRAEVEWVTVNPETSPFTQLPTLVTGSESRLTDVLDIAKKVVTEKNKGPGGLLGNEQTDKFALYALNEVFPHVITSDHRDKKTTLSLLHKVNKMLQPVTYAGNSKCMSIADLALFSCLSSVVPHWTRADHASLTDTCRWYDLIQHLVLDATKTPSPDWFVKFELDVETEKNSAVPKETTEKVEEKKTAKQKPSCPKESEASGIDVALVDLRVGRILECALHPEADSLYVEKIDLGEQEPRTIVSGLVKFIPIEEMQNRLVVVVANLKPAKLRNVCSQGMVLAASNADHTKVELLTPPAGAKIGERVIVDQFEPWHEPIAQLNPKKKLFEQVKPHLRTSDAGIGMYKDFPLVTSAGPCRVDTLSNCSIG